MSERLWKVYLSGEIHSDWREQIAAGVAEAGLPVRLDAPVTVHEDSDDCGAVILGEEENPFWRDQKGSRMNAIRTRTLIGEADIVVVRFATSTSNGTPPSMPASPRRSASRSSPCTTLR